MGAPLGCDMAGTGILAGEMSGKWQGPREETGQGKDGAGCEGTKSKRNLLMITWVRGYYRNVKDS